MNFKGKEYKLATILPWISEVVRGFKLRVAAAVVLGWAIVALNFLFVWLTKTAIDSATTGRSHRTIIAACVALVATVALQAAISAISRRLRTMNSFRMRRRLEQRLLHTAMTADWQRLGQYHTGDIVQRFTGDGHTVVSFVNGTIPTILLVLLQLAGAYAFLLMLSAKMALALALIVCLGVAFSKFHFLKIRAFSSKIKEGGSMLGAALQEGVENISVLKALAGRNLFERYYSHIFGVQESNVRQRLRYTIVSSTVLNVGFSACYLLVFIWGVMGLETSAITYGTLMAFVQLVGQIQGPSRTLISSIADFAEFYTSCERLNEIYAMPREAEPRPVSLGPVPPAIVCEGVTCSYDGDRKAVLRGFTHTFLPGTLCAIVGTTGAGKTTLMRLLLAYLKPESGRILLREGDGREVPVSIDTRGLFSYVPQAGLLLSMPLRDNMRMAKPDATDEEMLKALRMAETNFLGENADVLDMACGERGRGLSQGQAQRLCIARALLSPAPILLMDEATSALDRETETKIIENIRQGMRDKTVLFVTHRDTVIRYADEVVRIENERI